MNTTVETTKPNIVNGINQGDGTEEQFAAIHAAVMATSPNVYNVAHAVALKPTLVVE